MRTALFLPLDKKNMCDKSKGLRITLEKHIVELGVRYLSTLNREQDSAATVSYKGGASNHYWSVGEPI